MYRPLALAALVLALGAGAAHAGTQQFRVVVVPDLSTAAFESLSARGAVGLLVPANGPRTSGPQALASLTHGKVRNSFLDGGIPAGPPLVSAETLRDPPTGEPVIIVELPQGEEQPNDRRFPIVVIGDGFEGILTSPSTRLPGVVSIADVAPTALAEADGLGSEPHGHAAARVLELDRLIGEKKDARLVASVVGAALILLLALVFPRAALLGFATALTANLALGAAETTTPWLVCLVIATAILLAIPMAFVLRSPAGVGLALGAVLLLYLAGFLVDGTWIAYSPWGPAQAGRFYGVTNLLETILLVPALAGAALLARRFGGGSFALVAAAAFVLVAGGHFGADGGGALVLAAGFAVLGALLAGLHGRRLAAALGGAMLAGAGLIALDASTGGSSHVTDALRDGPGEVLSRLGDRLLISWERATMGPGPALVTFGCLAVLVALVIATLASDAPLADRALPLAVAASVGVSLLVNDAPNDVAAGGLLAFVACGAAMLRGRCAAAFCPRSPSAFSWPVAAARRASHPPRRR